MFSIQTVLLSSPWAPHNHHRIVCVGVCFRHNNHKLQAGHTRPRASYTSCTLLTCGDLRSGPLLRDKVNHRGKKFLTLILLVIHGPSTEMPASCFSSQLLRTHYMFTFPLTKRVRRHETARQHATQTTSHHVPVSASLVVVLSGEKMLLWMINAAVPV